MRFLKTKIALALKASERKQCKSTPCYVKENINSDGNSTESGIGPNIYPIVENSDVTSGLTSRQHKKRPRIPGHLKSSKDILSIKKYY